LFILNLNISTQLKKKEQQHVWQIIFAVLYIYYFNHVLVNIFKSIPSSA